MKSYQDSGSLNRWISVLLSGFVLITVASVASPAFARAEPRFELVVHDDLNLASESGVAALRARVRAAARRVCVNSGGSLSEQMNARRCFRRANGGASREVQLAAARERGRTQLAMLDSAG